MFEDGTAVGEIHVFTASLCIHGLGLGCLDQRRNVPLKLRSGQDVFAQKSTGFISCSLHGSRER